ncbi:hypothetical protein CYMTET_38397 [Cymbomonas tetramitiformis]|uniref:Uncharacterized protein n=1 Tax=Cymbomonas tetramitiformis TaxID=36881 RepID=A0AAE0F5J0_9CHLO|nr:hypothetical protein CYMTET_38397 [Cymbomonas tetramitiformis]
MHMEASRALVSLWATGAPEVVAEPQEMAEAAGTPCSSPTPRATLAAGVWSLTDHHLSTESDAAQRALRAHAYTVTISGNPGSSSFIGEGCDDVDHFRICGIENNVMQAARGEIRFSKIYQSGASVQYHGYPDDHGLWGISKRPYSASVVPWIFRMWRQ